MALDATKLLALGAALQSAAAADATQATAVTEAQNTVTATQAALTAAQAAATKAANEHAVAGKNRDAALIHRNQTTAPALAAARKAVTDYVEAAK